MTLYFDSSALVSVLLGEPGSPAISALLQAGHPAWISTLPLLECRRILRREGLDPGLLGRWLEDLGLYGVSEAVWERAGGPFAAGHLRALDALHVAAALELRTLAQDLVVVSTDRRLREHAAAEGLRVLP